MKKAIPYLLPLLMLGWVVATIKPPPKNDGFDVAQFGKLPALLEGRFQPLDSVARNSLLVLSGKQSLRLPAEEGKRGKTLSASSWLMESLMKPEQADERKIFRIDHDEVRSIFRLADREMRPRAEDDKRRGSRREKFFSLNDLKGGLKEFGDQADKIAQHEEANHLEPQQRTPFQKQVMKLYQHLIIYQRLKNSLQPEDSQDFAKELEQYQSSIAPGVAAAREQKAGQDHDKQAMETLLSFVGAFDRMSRMSYPLMVPPINPGQDRNDWESVGTNLMQAVWSGEIHPAVKFYARMSSAYRQAQPEAFNSALSEYQGWLAGRFIPETKKAGREFFFNTFAPFYKSLVIYVLAFILACASWLNMSRWLNRSSFNLILLALVIHTIGLLFRMFLEGRPPVTNLYSSAIFIGWGAVILGIVLECFYRDGIGSVTAASVGFVTLIIAHNLALGGDTMIMLQAVLDTNFWLATHVVVVTLGYAATFVAGFLAILYVVRGVFTRSLSQASAKALTRMVYGIVCFATLFSFVGTVLGGIWADQSWGRFWGWDPKENGALLIVIWNAAFLHARWGKLFPDRFLMAMPIFGNIVTGFSWFGVNMLGIGLHSYGFMDQAFKWLVAFDISQLLFIALACVPLRYWRSFQSAPPPSGPSRASSKPPHKVQAAVPQPLKS